MYIYGISLPIPLGITTVQIKTVFLALQKPSLCHSLANHTSPEIIPFSDVHHFGGLGTVPRMNSHTRMTPRAFFHVGCFHAKTLFLRFIPDVVTRIVPPSLFTDEYYSTVCSCRSLLIGSLVGCSGCFQAEASVGQLARTLLATSLYTQGRTQAFPWIIHTEAAGSKNRCVLHSMRHF